MAQIKPSLAKGTRDFTPIDMQKRNFIFGTIKEVFKKYGYQEIQTPSFENLSTLTGKYGEEGDQLIFKILNSGDYLSKVAVENYAETGSNAFTPLIAEKALRYDLTVPFARYVVMHQNEITFPFKRYQIQPVWRADRPQKGRYREFYQCDVDVVGSESLLNEAEFILIYHEALAALNLNDVSINLNNRKILAGIAEVLEKPSLLIPMTIAIDKLDKIGMDGVLKELKERGFLDADIHLLRPIIQLAGSNTDQLHTLKHTLAKSAIAMDGIRELEEVLSLVEKMDKEAAAKVQIDITLARGLNYYTGCIFEVRANRVNIGSIGGGGRYDDLTGMFGLKGLSGVGISFGADRIYDVMTELNCFPPTSDKSTQVLITNIDPMAFDFCLSLLQKLRSKNIAAELYPTNAKLKKQLSYADSKAIPFTAFVGQDELEKGVLSVKDMKSGAQMTTTLDELIKRLS